MTLTITTTGNVSVDSSTPSFMSSVADAIERAGIERAGMESSDNPPRVSVVPNGNRISGSDPVITLRIAPDNSPELPPPSVPRQDTAGVLAFASPDAPLPAPTSTVLITTDSTGRASNAARITVSDNLDGSSSTVSIQIADIPLARETSSIMLDEGCALPVASVVFGFASTDDSTGRVQNIFLVVPPANDETGSSFLISNVIETDHIDMASAFGNDGMTILSQDGFGSSYGGAVSITVNGKTFIVWLNLGKNIPSGFSGDVEASFGTLESDPYGDSSSVSGYLDTLNITFMDGEVCHVSQDDIVIEDFDCFIKDKIASSEGPPDISMEEDFDLQKTINTQAVSYVANYAGYYEAITTSLAISDPVDRRNFFNKVAQDVLSRSSIQNAAVGV